MTAVATSEIGPDLRGEAWRRAIDVVGEVPPGARRAGTLACPPSLPSIPTSRDRGDLVRERAESLRHVVDGVCQRADLAPWPRAPVAWSSRRWPPT
jgi:hypothetical protein